MMAPPSSQQAIWLLIRLRLQRLRNLSGSALLFKRGQNGKSRAATPGKRRGRWLIGVLLMAPMLFSFGHMAQKSVLNLHCQLDAVAACGLQQAMPAVIAHLTTTPFSAALLAGLSFQLTLLWLVSVLVPLGTGELARPDWDLEWLVTLPTPMTTLLWARVFERSVVNPAGMLAVLPTTTMVAWYSGHGWLSPVLALAVSLVLLLLAAMLRTLVDTGLRLSLAPSKLGNLQAMISILSLLPMYAGMSFGMGQSGFMFGWVATLPAWISWTPPGQIVAMLNAREASTALLAAGALLAQSMALLALGMAILRRQLRHGVVGSGQRANVRKAAISAPVAPGRWQIGSVIQRRELTLLKRDRNFLVQTMFLPLLILGSQVVFTGRLHDVHELLDSPALVASTGFFLGTYTLMMSAFQNLNKEGGALWLLYTFPVGVEQALREKAQLWAMLAMIYPVIMFGAALAWMPAWRWDMAGLMLLALAGIPLYAVIGVALGVFASDPQATEAAAKMRPSYMYLYLLLTSLYIAALAAGSVVQQLVFVVLTAALAVALWQKARDEVPYLLDPAASPPARVSFADGLMAAMLFFVLQVLAMLLLKGKGETNLQQIALAFGIAGATTYAAMRLLYWRSKATGVPRIQQGRPAWPLVLAGTALTALFGVGYTMLLHAYGLAPPASLLLAGQWSWLWLGALAVLAAPLCEEFIFRGLLQGGLRRSLPAWQAIIIGAAIFAIVHPPASMLPVFVLGLCTGWAYEKSGALLAPMLVHGSYNAVVLACQFVLL
ncbi:CPBP family intramembrane glutamic endopeptidase [Janthinobacterium sp. RB2R34]|uniref:CPBP family intramembrane glutamic endopeptidase n=1 Tax=Janthinobacterium sp. RB2R34 TaxID=3424193 RepID=UPI003F2192EA